MLTRQQKQKIIDDTAKDLKEKKAVVFVDYKGLKVSQMKDLRRQLKVVETDLKASKKTLIDLALKKAGLAGISIKALTGQIALALGGKDEVSGAKALAAFSKKNESLKILGAILEGKFLNQAEAVALSKVPAKEQSLVRLLGVINSPISGFVSALNGNLKNLVFVLSQIKK